MGKGGKDFGNDFIALVGPLESIRRRTHCSGVRERQLCAAADSTVTECIFTALSNFHSVNVYVNTDVDVCISLQVVAILLCFFSLSFHSFVRHHHRRSRSRLAVVVYRTFDRIGVLVQLSKANTPHCNCTLHI